jgi:hypothetical protein
LRASQLHLTATGVQPPTINATVTVPRFFFKVTLDRPEMTRHLVFVYETRKLPRVLSPEEVLRLAADERDRSGPAARRSVPLLRRTHAHHRDLRRRLPATPPANKACHRDQDRYLMSTNMIFPVLAHIPSQSTTGNATAWPDGCPPSHSRPHAAPKHGLRPASSKRASQTIDHNHVSPAPRRLRDKRTVRTKSP